MTVAGAHRLRRLGDQLTENVSEQRRLASVIAIEGLLGDSCRGGDRVHARARETLGEEQLARRDADLLALGLSSQLDRHHTVQYGTAISAVQPHTGWLVRLIGPSKHSLALSLDFISECAMIWGP